MTTAETDRSIFQPNAVIDVDPLGVTSLVLGADAEPCRIVSHCNDLTAARDAAAQLWGAPLNTGTWAPYYSDEERDLWACACWAPSKPGAKDPTAAPVSVLLTSEEIGLLLEALVSHEYWQISDEADRSDGYVVSGPSAETEEYVACEQLREKLKAASPQFGA